MLREINRIQRDPGEPWKRWFTDDYFDLFVWLDDSEEIIRFQLTYSKNKGERALSWQKGKGFSHDGVDDGESRPGKPKSTPILTADGVFDSRAVAERLEKASARIEPRIAGFVLERIAGFPAP